MPSELAIFLQEYMDIQLSQLLDLLGIGFYTKTEKPLQNARFDVYAYSRKRSSFLIWELEVNNCPEGCIENVKKVEKVLNYNWLPYVHMFHIFSPFCESYMESCAKTAAKLKKKNEIRFTYRQFYIAVPYDEFETIYKAFDRNRRRAELRYGTRLKIRLGKIIRKSLSMFSGE